MSSFAQMRERLRPESSFGNVFYFANLAPLVTVALLTAICVLHPTPTVDPNAESPASPVSVAMQLLSIAWYCCQLVTFFNFCAFLWLLVFGRPVAAFTCLGVAFFVYLTPEFSGAMLGWGHSPKSLVGLVMFLPAGALLFWSRRVLRRRL